MQHRVTPVLIAPSILSADFLNLGRDISMLNTSSADWIHVDIMDGNFVPNISFGMPLLEAVGKVAKKPLDVHLMITKPEKFLKRFQELGADMISVHYEGSFHLHSTVMKIKELGMKAGVVLNPHTPVHVLDAILPYADYVLLMSVNPGFGGQKFIEGSVEKVRELRRIIDQQKLHTLIQVDGGVNTDNAPALIAAGADVLVAGSAVFNDADPSSVINRLKGLIN
jgi:ribulose-phosphate 3-epimerase